MRNQGLGTRGVEKPTPHSTGLASGFVLLRSHGIMWSQVFTSVGAKIVRHVGVREFRDRATGLLREAEPIAVERHGKVIGFYIPVESKKGNDEELKEALARLDASVKRVLEETGMTEDELAGYFDLSRSAPELPPDHRKRAPWRG